MPAACFYFQLHQPRRLRRFTAFDGGTDYFDEAANAEILRRVATRSYLPGLRLLRGMLAEGGAESMRVGLSVTGELMEQLAEHAPAVLEELAALAATGKAEFLGETYHHSLASFYDLDEFESQVVRHAEAVRERFGQTPVVFRNTELLYSDALAAQLVELGGYTGVLTEGVERSLGGRSPNRLYAPALPPAAPADAHADAPAATPPAILLRNHPLSDAIGFRFGVSGPHGGRLTATHYARLLADQPGDVVGVFLDFEVFGEHQAGPKHTFDFLAGLPEALASAGVPCVAPAEAIDLYRPVGRLAAPKAISWADRERDLSAWLGNAMQASAAADHYALAGAIARSGDEPLLRDWRRLSNSDHLYYMSTKGEGDGAVHRSFSPYESPYAAYINYMNVLDSLRARARG
ncbi:glycoside hydrolase family 57 protein [Phycisphaera mikurensis]|uniref:Glycoside hydrolase family 57 N-terminal domain-containing protein n=1 Tax=Phycisphaera mikurensis (strain NBRC 102666 / KCTC 22515 / FYK2301M01) TaxID=1142394 RepID=I0IH47_PHYMF|nr:glycoside hydrolase family 57 protein [Phycisphaera mikurensis]MBB6440839.1 alpha-amylase [Phycisphaera mikurensis]BAM04585.1 hypothetical protein PSMK_24260 [Phycisphaera mikurensis NBRC 102666]